MTALLVLLEAPEAGVVKPRLAGTVGPLQATRLYRVLVARILAAAFEAGFTPTIWFRPLVARACVVRATVVGSAGVGHADAAGTPAPRPQQVGGTENTSRLRSWLAGVGRLFRGARRS